MVGVDERSENPSRECWLDCKGLPCETACCTRNSLTQGDMCVEAKAKPPSLWAGQSPHIAPVPTVLPHNSAPIRHPRGVQI